jgi:hypothetical protein
MMLGLSLHAVTVLHVVISLIGIVTGLVVLYGLFKSQSMPGMTAIFLLTTILTNATGFMFPFEKLLPSHIIAILSLVLLAIACFALYGQKLSGAWRPIYVITAVTSLYLNVFVLVIQSFLKIGPLHELAPSVPPSEPPFALYPWSGWGDQHGSHSHHRRQRTQRHHPDFRRQECRAPFDDRRSFDRRDADPG